MKQFFYEYRSHKLMLFLLAAGLFGLHAQAAASSELKVGGSVFQFNRSTGNVSSTGNLQISQGGIQLIDGNTGKTLEKFSLKNFQANNQKIAFTQDYNSEKVICENSVEKVFNQIIWTAKLNNRGSASRRLLVKLQLSVTMPKGAVFWNGEYIRNYLVGEYTSDDCFGLPLSALYKEGNSGIAIGIDANTYFSYIGNGITSGDGTDITYYYAARMVIDPDDAEEIKFVLFDFDGRYGYLDAVQIYHDMYRSNFAPNKDVDPRVRLAECLYYTIYKPSKQELARRSRWGFSWWYAPFKRSGDFYGRKEYWSFPSADEWFKKNRLLKKGLYRDRFGMSTEYRDLSPEGGSRGNITDFDAFHNQRRNFLLDAERDNNVAPMFYLAPWTDKKMLEARWPELLVDDERYSIHFKRYVLHYDTDEMRTFWGGAFAVSTQKDLQQIAKELNISGFAFDVSTGGPRFYTNKKVDGMPGRAYDKRGVFYDTGIGIAMMQKFIHNLDVKPFWGGHFKAGVAANLGISRYYAAFNVDSAVIESGDVGEALNSIEKFINHKILMGNKSSISHESQNRYHVEIATLDWQNMSPAEIRTIYRRIFAGNLLVYYKVGIIPGGDLCFGIEKLQKELPRLVELVLSGWQPVPAFKVAGGDDPELLLSRYGIGVNSFLAAGNASFKTKQVKCQVDNKYLGDYQWIFSQYSGSSLNNVVNDGVTEVEGTIASGDVFVLKAQLGVANKNDFIAKVAQNDQLQDGVITATLNMKQADNVEMICQVPADAQIASVKINAINVEFTTTAKSAKFTSRLKAGNNQIEIKYLSEIFHCAKVDLLDFPFVKNLTPDCTIVVRDNAGAKEMLIAERIREYFNFYYAYKDEQYQKANKIKATKAITNVSIPITALGKVKKKHNLVYVGQVDDYASNALSLKIESGVHFEPKAKVISIASGNDDELFQIAEKFMYVLDEKYYWLGMLPNAGSKNMRECMQKAGLWGGVLYEKE